MRGHERQAPQARRAARPDPAQVLARDEAPQLGLRPRRAAHGRRRPAREVVQRRRARAGGRPSARRPRAARARDARRRRTPTARRAGSRAAARRGSPSGAGAPDRRTASARSPCASRACVRAPRRSCPSRGSPAAARSAPSTRGDRTCSRPRRASAGSAGGACGRARRARRGRRRPSRGPGRLRTARSISAKKSGTSARSASSLPATSQRVDLLERPRERLELGRLHHPVALARAALAVQDRDERVALPRTPRRSRASGRSTRRRRARGGRGSAPGARSSRAAPGRCSSSSRNGHDRDDDHGRPPATRLVASRGSARTPSRRRPSRLTSRRTSRSARGIRRSAASAQPST